jgi:DNA-directed RNA polymerase subunit M/transcription elongation factor TFIIS
MADIFESTILCNSCNARMEKQNIAKNGFILRAVVCPKCGSKVMHPADEAEYEKFINLKNKEFHVKMRMVGNSYAVSIPMEIVSFIKEQENKMNDMVKLCFEEAGRLSLNFNNPGGNGKANQRIIKAREVKIVKNGKTFHARQFYDSANPKNSKSFLIKKTSKEENQ